MVESPGNFEGAGVADNRSSRTSGNGRRILAVRARVRPAGSGAIEEGTPW